MAALTKLTTNINLEMSGDTKRYLVSAKQGDKATRFIVARLLNNGEPYTIPTGARAVINITKPDGKHVYNTTACKEVTERAEDALQNQEQLEATLNTATQIRQDVSQMQTAVAEAKKQVEQDKKDIDDTIQNSLLASAEKILESVQDYFNRAEALYSSMYLDCDGETPYLRTVTPIFIDGATPQVRNANEGVDFDGGTPTSRQLAV